MKTLDPSDITPEPIYLNRRRFMQGAGAALAAALLASCAGQAPTPGATATADPNPPRAGAAADERGEALTPYADVTGYNNFYELSMGKEGLAQLTGSFKATPWSVQVGGLVHKPRAFDIDELRKLGQEERIYRLRCVEAWSMVIPWIGFPLARLLESVEPKAEARFVRFETLNAPEQLPGMRASRFDWPYVEGLRLDEARHDLTILATGLYGKPMPVQNGAPVRLVVPWKYGFKSIKSIVRIDLVASQPTTFWMHSGPAEYGFYANVNPAVAHPRWSQATERRIGEDTRRPTLLFNGYGEQVAGLYAGMDLKANY